MMPAAKPQKYRTALACGIVVTAVVAAATAFAHPEKDAAETIPGLYCCEADGFRYEYHAPSGYEGLYELRSAPGVVVDVIGSHSDVAARCRRALEERLHVRSLDSLRAEYHDTIQRLKALGYL
jgi:hypothetical protein